MKSFCTIWFWIVQRDRVKREEITSATLRNYVKAIKLFCEMCDIPIAWKKLLVVYQKVEDSLMIVPQH